MKIALVHDYIKEYGGAERVLEALHELYPDAPVYTTVYLPEFLGPHKDRFKNWDIRTSWAQGLPFKSKLISPLRLIAPFLFKSFDFSKYDVVIVSATGAYNPNTIRIKNHESRSMEKENYTLDAKRYPLHISYTHTPPRYLYGYATARDWKKNPFFRVLGEVANHFLRMVDFKSAQNVDYFIANSEEVRSRIKKFYRRDSTVVYPPVETDSIKYTVSSIKQNKKNTKYILHNTNYYVAGGRLARAKHIDLIVQSFVELGLPLKVFGKGFVNESIKYQVSSIKDNNKDSNIEFVGEVSDEEKINLMRNAKAFVNASEDEDFGITPVESMMVGTPVIAYCSGGLKETIVEGKTGVFFHELSVQSIQKAIKRFNDLNHFSMREACIKQAQKFSKEEFLRKVKKFVEDREK